MMMSEFHILNVAASVMVAKEFKVCFTHLSCSSVMFLYLTVLMKCVCDK